MEWHEAQNSQHANHHLGNNILKTTRNKFAKMPPKKKKTPKKRNLTQKDLAAGKKKPVLMWPGMIPTDFGELAFSSVFETCIIAHVHRSNGKRTQLYGKGTENVRQ